MTTQTPASILAEGVAALKAKRQLLTVDTATDAEIREYAFADLAAGITMDAGRSRFPSVSAKAHYFACYLTAVRSRGLKR